MGHREDLLAGARRCLEQRGYARTTARDLVAESGTNLASIGYHFGSKEALLNEAIGLSCAEWAEHVRALALAVEGDEPRTMLVASWDAMLASFAEYRGLAVAFTEAMTQAHRRPELRAQLAEIYEECRAAVAAMIAEILGVEEGPQVRALASFELVVFDGLLAQWLLDPDAVPSGAELGAAFEMALRRFP
ncbi:MAG: TetR/AcrR family transcriptional regulator [Actinomycetes bacterium]